MPKGAIRPPEIARFGRPPGEILIWTMRPGSRPAWQAKACPTLNIVVELEFVGMRPQTHRLRLILALVLDKRFDQVFGKYIAAHHECVVFFEAAERLVERSRHGRNGLHFLR